MTRKKLYAVGSAALMAVACATVAAPFGGKEDLSYAAKLWKTMTQNDLVGKHALYSTPYKGVFPHGEILDTVDGYLMVGDHKGRLIIKRNYGGEGITKAMVANDPAKHLKAVTVMYQREKGYDKENQNWFWVKYTPTGEVMKNPKEMSLAGRVAKGSDQGCIACHKAAPGGDMVYNNDRMMNGKMMKDKMMR